jgi:hypothetical protein
MAITFPLPLAKLADFLPISGITWRVQRADEFAGLGSSQSIPIELADPLWAADITLDKSRWGAQRIIDARLNSLEGSMKAFELANPLARAPASDPTGAILGASVVTVHTVGPDFDSLRFTGLPAGYTLTEGDFCEINFGADPVRRAPFQLLETVTASGAGVTPLARVFPHVWPGITAGLAVKLINPTGIFFITPNSLQTGQIRRALVEGSTFSALQRI